jgi:hypothetical protein
MKPNGHSENHVQAKLQLSSFYSDGLRQNSDLFSRKYQNFTEDSYAN